MEEEGKKQEKQDKLQADKQSSSDVFFRPQYKDMKTQITNKQQA